MKKGLDLGPFPSNHANFFLDIMPMTDLFFQDKISFDSCKVIGSVIAELVTRIFALSCKLDLYTQFQFSQFLWITGADLEFLKRGADTLCWPPWLANK